MKRYDFGKLFSRGYLGEPLKRFGVQGNAGQFGKAICRVEHDDGRKIEIKTKSKTKSLGGTIVDRLRTLSQVNFGLGVSEKTVQGWEQGMTRPSSMALRFLDEIRNDPDYWCRRLKQLATNGSKS